MIRYLRYVFFGGLAVLLVTVALANRGTVTLHALPPDLAALTGLGWAMELPLFLVIFGGIATGLLIGFVWEWFREGKHRSAASAHSREAARLERELSMLRDAKGQVQDDVLAILDRKKAS